MAEYYLIAQLPSLDGIGDNTPLPITEERFLELCSRFLEKKWRSEVETIRLLPSVEPEKTNSSLLKAWYEGERNLRLALAKARAEKLGKSFESKLPSIPIELSKAVAAAVEIENPLEAEQLLFRYRLDFLETLRPSDAFSEEYLFYYGIKLKWMLRMRGFESESGKEAYQNIYNSILNGDQLEALS